MADDASLPVLELGSVNAGRDLLMALQAKRVDASGQQHARIHRGMRSVAGQASFDPDRLVLVDEGSTFVGVALQADQVLIGRRPDLAVPQRAVGIVAVGALDQALVHAMAERLLEINSLFLVARVAQLGLLAHQEVL